MLKHDTVVGICIVFTLGTVYVIQLSVNEKTDICSLIIANNALFLDFEYGLNLNLH